MAATLLQGNNAQIIVVVAVIKFGICINDKIGCPKS